MNHLDSSINARNYASFRPVDVIVNTLAIVIVCGLLYKGTHALFDVDSGHMFRSGEIKGEVVHHA